MNEKRAVGGQNARVLKYMKLKGSITVLDAQNDLGVTRLSARIYDLKEAGYRIREERNAPVSNRYGETCRVTRYKLEEENHEADADHDDA